MGYITTGINHTTAPVSLREQFVFSQEHLLDALQDAKQYIKSREVAILSTCNRTELYCTDASEPKRILSWLKYYHNAQIPGLADHVYTYHGKEAIRHIMRVACGLDSMIIGEPQILGQLKDAYTHAQQAGTAGTLLNRLFQQSFFTAKQVRTQTTIGKLPISIAYTATMLAKQIFADLSTNTALLIGAGKTIQLAAHHLKKQGLNNLIIANRSLERAKKLANFLGGQAVLLSDLTHIIQYADIIISATSSPTHVLSKRCVEHALKTRKHRPILMIDIAVPRDIESAVGDLADVFLYTVDDLHDVIEDNLQQRKEAVVLAEDIIESGLSEFMSQIRSLDAVKLLRRYREKSEHLRNIEVQKAMQALTNGAAPKQVLSKLAHSITNKMMHAPSIQLKKAAASGQNECLEWAEKLLDLNNENTRKVLASISLPTEPSLND
ncbi:MAG: glutamyl-tRNA reductase [Candidatus Endonucleobacter bathymodioli]|uniref:Glutamyl-tRNA reductase n=1 Tax=Candidatus Endonucleibacter bathymodioli TaxID=539814 RepID=A0AA90P0H0_9GAMM|nr:glutamyl-tRNA reductase [Candidatus Endonucleobacter bathymodioli]